MADDAPRPSDSPNIQPAPSAAPAATTAHVTSAPPPPAAPPRRPRHSWVDPVKDFLRSALYMVIGAVVGALVGLILNYTLVPVLTPNADVRLVVGAGLLLGIFFSGSIVRMLHRAHGPVARMLHLPPPKERPARAAAGASQASGDDQVATPARETVEMLVSVVILVVLLKSFDAEAYVIPTGSMAETLLGDQKWVVCPSCGYRFPVDCSDQVDPMKSPNVWISGCTCPNCREHITFTGRGENLSQAGDVPDPPVGGGDRILAGKFMYDLFGTLPDRLDVVVFKFPGRDGVFPPRESFKDGVQINYIKRLVGLPGETIAVHGGDLYVLPPDKGHQWYEDDLKEAAKTTYNMDPARRLWEKQFLHFNDPGALTQFRNHEFQIIRKPPETLLAMRRIVYDNDHPAKDLHTARWADRDKDGAWKADDAHGFHLAAPTDAAKDGVHWLGYSHLLRGREKDGPQVITDFMGYNTAEPTRGSADNNWVGDLILECDVQADQAQGELTLELSKGVDRFRARFDLGTGVCTLLRDGQDKPLDSKPTALKGGGRHSVRFANVDQRLTVWVDDALPFGDGVTYPPPDNEGENANDRQPASIGVKGTGAAVRALKLWRDTYYTTTYTTPTASPRTITDTPTLTMYVQPGHYLCMGDNSPMSSDGRFWGLVPDRLLLGKAIAVFYPLDRLERIR